MLQCGFPKADIGERAQKLKISREISKRGRLFEVAHQWAGGAENLCQKVDDIILQQRSIRDVLPASYSEHF